MHNKAYIFRTVNVSLFNLDMEGKYGNGNKPENDTATYDHEKQVCLLPFTCNYVVSVRRGFLFLWVLGMGGVILLWHSLSVPYNYFLIQLNRL